MHTFFSVLELVRLVISLMEQHARSKGLFTQYVRHFFQTQVPTPKYAHLCLRAEYIF